MQAFNQIIAIIIWFLPFFLVPFAFKMAGGAIATLHNAIDSRGKRAHQGVLGNQNDPGSLRNRVRRNTAARLADAGLSGKELGARANPRNWRRGRMRGRRQAIRNAYQAHYGRQGMGAMLFEENHEDDMIMKDLAKHGTTGASQKAIEDDIASGKLERGSSAHQARIAASATADMIGRNGANRRKALMQNSTIGYGFGAGQEGWDEAVGIIDDIAGDDPFLRRTMMNEFQANAKSVGRADLAGNTEGNSYYDGHRAWSSVGLYQHGNGKPKAVEGAGDYYRGLWDRAHHGTLTNDDINTHLKANYTQAEIDNMTDAEKKTNATRQAKLAVGTFTKEMGTIGQSASGAVRDEARKQQRIMLGNADVAQLVNPRDAAGNALDPQHWTDDMVEVDRRSRGYDPAEAQRRNTP